MIKIFKRFFKSAHRTLGKFLPFFNYTPDTSYSTIPSKNLKFKDIFYQHNQNVSDKWVNYFDIYDSCMERYRGNNSKILEIGIQNGGTLQIFNKYLQNAELFGVDIDPNIANLSLENNIHIFNFDITDEQAIAKHFNKIKFDIIIDDGSHISSDIIKTFRLLFSKLKPGGIFLIEDLHASYWKSHGGSYLGDNSAIEFFKKFADLLNFYHINDPQFDQIFSESDKFIFQWLQSISFYDSVVVVHKLLSSRKKHYERVMVGKIEPVVPVIKIAKEEDWYHHS
ncbi:MAG: class I SAM-dependent methyltransferase [Candidatus Rickettsiella isopodorum]|nr:class I SAM-dependent methyltransferase [Gammaproteobacteria bacterium]